MNMRKSAVFLSIFSLTAVTMIGCSKPPAKPGTATTPKPATSGAPSANPQSAAAGVWSPDPDTIKLYTQFARVSNYQFQLSKDLMATDLPKLPDSVKMGVFAGSLTTNENALLSISIMKDPKLIKELSSAKPGQAIKDYAAGYGKSAGLRVGRTYPSETGKLDGIDFERMKWNGTANDGTPVLGYTYIGAVDDSAIIITAYTTDKNPNMSLRMMEKMISTLKKQ